MPGLLRTMSPGRSSWTAARKAGREIGESDVVACVGGCGDNEAGDIVSGLGLRLRMVYVHSAVRRSVCPPHGYGLWWHALSDTRIPNDIQYTLSQP